jgi:chromosomal replication initiation ATPase DnaA
MTPEIEILKVICRELQMDFDEVKNRKTRLREFVYARQLYSYFCKEYTNESLAKIGKFINKNHATMFLNTRLLTILLTKEKGLQKKLF